MNPIKKILIVLDKINDVKEISPENTRIHFNYFDDFEDELSEKEVDNILNKLEKDEKIISNYKYEKGIEFGTNEPLCEYFFYVIAEKFDNYYNDFKKTISNRKDSNSTHPIQILDNEKKNLIYQITYNQLTDEIIVNNYFVLSMPHYDSVNKHFFKYVYENPNKDNRVIDIRSYIKSKTGFTTDKKVHNIINDLGFKKDLHKAFFKLSKTTVFFRNPVTQEDLDKLGIKKLKFSQKA